MADTKIHAFPHPDGSGFSVTYETTSGGRKVHQFSKQKAEEAPPHGAGSFHDPDQHYTLIERHEAYLRAQNT